MKKIIFRTFYLIIAMIIITPIVFSFEAEAGGGGGSKEYATYSNIWILETTNEKEYNGSMALVVETYIKSNTGTYVKSPHIQDTIIGYNKQPGSTTLTVEAGYKLNKVEIWKNNTIQSQYNKKTFDLNNLNNSNNVLKIFVEEKNSDLGYDNTNTSGGKVNLNKTATPINDKNNEYDLEFSVQGEAITKGKNADIILVLDKSGSMKDSIGNNKSKAQVLEEAANRFIDEVLSSSNSGNNRVAVITYSDEAQLKQAFTNNKTTAKNAYKNFNSMISGGTNSESGFIAARLLFGTDFRVGAEKFVVYMTDGVPTQYYNINGDVVGLGNNYDVNAKNAAIEEANLLKSYGGNGIKIYTIGFAKDNSDEMEQLLNPTTNSYQEGYYHANTADDLTGIYDLIADTIIDSVAKNTVIKDTLPEGFEFIKGSLPENVVVSDDGEMTWNLGSITTTKASKKVKIRYTGENYGVIFANEGATIKYKHILSPNEFTENSFVNPIVVVTPNVAEYVYYTNNKEEIIITPPSMSLINEAGNDYVISNLMIKVDGITTNKKSSVKNNKDYTQITYTPANDYSEDSFKYKVYFTVTSSTDPMNLFDGTSKTYETKVNVIVNPKPDINLTIRYFEVLNGVNKPLSINGTTSLVKQLPNNAFIDEFAPVKTGYNFDSMNYTNINNPVIINRRITGQLGTKNATINYYYNRDNSMVFDNILYNNAKYKNDQLQPIGGNVGLYDVVTGINYRFGLKFQAGQNVDNIELVFSGTDGFTIDNFNLYDEHNNLVRGPENNYDLLKPYINANSTYTITYRLKPNDSGKSMNVQVNNANLESSGIPSTITIRSIGTLELE